MTDEADEIVHRISEPFSTAAQIALKLGYYELTLLGQVINFEKLARDHGFKDKETGAFK